eukprot:1157795-Pelagomonas_calceolata.AAC.9
MAEIAIKHQPLGLQSPKTTQSGVVSGQMWSFGGFSGVSGDEDPKAPEGRQQLGMGNTKGRGLETHSTCARMFQLTQLGMGSFLKPPAAAAAAAECRGQPVQTH